MPPSLNSLKRKRIIAAVLFLGILAGLNFLVAEVYTSAVLGVSRAAQQAKYYIGEARENGCDILVLGDSHPGSAIRPEFFERQVTKWSGGAESYFKVYYKLRHVITEIDTPEIVVIPLDLHSFRMGRKCDKLNEGNDYFWVKYMDYMEFGRITNSTGLLIKKYLRGHIFPYLGGSPWIYQWICKDMKGAGARMFAPLSPRKKVAKKQIKLKKIQAKKRKGWEKAARKQANYHFYKRKPVERVLRIYFIKILDLCQKENIPVLLVKYPVDKAYYEQIENMYFKPAAFYREVETFLHGRKNIHMLDLQKIFFSRPGYMYDAHHVTYHGAAVVSVKVSTEIDRILSKKAGKVQQ